MTTTTKKSFHDLVADVKPHINEVDAATLKQWLADNPDFVLIDTREPQEYAQGIIGHATSSPRGVLEMYINDLAPDHSQKVVLYCGGGNRSALAAYSIQQMGYDNVFSLAGGYKGWIASGN